MSDIFSGKRGQGMGTYILIGVVLLVIFVFSVYVYSSAQRGRTGEEAEKASGESMLPSLKLYMKESIEQASVDVIKEIGPHGGTLDPDPSAWWGPIEIAYTCYEQNAALPGACVNTMITRRDIEEELASRILQNLNSIIDLTMFREQGIEITEGPRSVRVILGKTALVIELNYPLELKRKNKIEKTDRFQSTVKSPLGILYDLSKHITNTETQEKEFNVTEWYEKNPGIFITIEKEQLGQDRMFQLASDDYPYNFAMVKVDLENSVYGCCYDRYDYSCFKNVPEEECARIDGEYDPDPLCVCRAEARLSCIVSLPGAGCTDPYTEVLRLSGFENAHVSLPGEGDFQHSLCCNIIAFFITQQPDIMGTECSGTGTVFARMSSAESAHMEDAGLGNFQTKACISAENSRITCRLRPGNCEEDEEPIISLMSPANAHVGYSYKYHEKICCEAERIS